MSDQERLLDLLQQVEFDRTPLTDIKTISQCDIGIIEGGVANEQNLKVLHEFREHCKVLVSVGDCAINGGVPAMRNMVPLEECYREAFLDGPTVHNPEGRAAADIDPRAARRHGLPLRR